MKRIITNIDIIPKKYFTMIYIIVKSGLSMVYFNLQYPSDVVASFEFGAVWISLIIILLEVYRVLSKVTYIK